MKVNSYNFQNISIMRGKTEGPALFGREYCKKGISARNEVTSIEASISILIKIWTVFLCVVLITLWKCNRLSSLLYLH